MWPWPFIDLDCSVKVKLIKFLFNAAAASAMAYSNSPVCVWACVDYIENLKILFWKTTSPISTKLGRIVPWIKGFQGCSKNLIPCRKRNNKDNFKKSSCKDPHGLECSGPLPRLFKLKPLGQNWPRPGGHWLWLCTYSKNLKNLIVWRYKA
jgi:hypothetical protein